MKLKKSLLTGLIAVMLSTVLLFMSVIVVNNTSNHSIQVSASSRTIELTEQEMDAQGILDEFTNAVLTTEGTQTVRANTNYSHNKKQSLHNDVNSAGYITNQDLYSECYTV